MVIINVIEEYDFVSILISYPFFFLSLFLVSVLHEYKDWDENNRQLTTCNKDTKNLIQSNTVPQEVEEGKEIVFTYDVAFKVTNLPMRAY